MTKQMLAYHGDAAFRRRFLAEIRKHEKADEIVRGTYGKVLEGKWRGCAVGCTLRSINRIKKRKRIDERTDVHARYPKELGVPLELAHLEDLLFESLPIEQAMRWPMRFSSAIKAGADLSLVWPRFAHWLLVDETDGVLQFAKTGQARDASRGVAALFERQIAGQEVTRAEWQEARSASSASSAYAAYAAASAAFADAAYAAAYAAASAAASAAFADAADAADAAARSRAYARQADKLIELLEAAPVVRRRKRATP